MPVMPPPMVTPSPAGSWLIVARYVSPARANVQPPVTPRAPTLQLGAARPMPVTTASKWSIDWVAVRVDDVEVELAGLSRAFGNV